MVAGRNSTWTFCEFRTYFECAGHWSTKRSILILCDAICLLRQTRNSRNIPHVTRAAFILMIGAWQNRYYWKSVGALPFVQNALEASQNHPCVAHTRTVIPSLFNLSLWICRFCQEEYHKISQTHEHWRCLLVYAWPSDVEEFCPSRLLLILHSCCWTQLFWSNTIML